MKKKSEVPGSKLQDVGSSFFTFYLELETVFR